MRKLKPADFKKDALKVKGNVGVLFYAEWCPFCMGFRPLYENADQEDFELTLADISDDDNPLWEMFGIENVPTVIAFKDGRAVWRRDCKHHVGLDGDDLRDLLEVLGR